MQLQKRQRRRVLAEINVVPYIDVMLVLLIVFMITAPMMTGGIQVELPKVAAEPLPATDDEPLIVTVRQDGTYFLRKGSDHDMPVREQELLTQVRQWLTQGTQPMMLVNADRHVPYGEVVRLMAALQQAGVHKVGLMTDNTLATPDAAAVSGTLTASGNRRL